MNERESMPYDVVIVGAGPAGLSAAIRLKQLANEAGREITVCVLEKGSEVGAHILSGAVIDPRALDELLPDWRDQGCPLAEVPVTENHHWILNATGKTEMPHFALPPFMSNEGTYTCSLGSLCRWLAEQAEGLGVEIFPASPRPRCCSTKMDRSRASRPATWALHATVPASRTGSPDWSSTPNIPSLQRASVGTSARS